MELYLAVETLGIITFITGVESAEGVTGTRMRLSIITTTTGSPIQATISTKTITIIITIRSITKTTTTITSARSAAAGMWLQSYPWLSTTIIITTMRRMRRIQTPMTMGKTTLGAGILPAEEEGTTEEGIRLAEEEEGTTEEGEAAVVEVVEEAEVTDMIIIEYIASILLQKKYKFV